MSKVYLLKNFTQLQEQTKKLLHDFYVPDTKIMVKIHFGEPGNKMAFTPDDIQKSRLIMKPWKFNSQ